MIKTVWKICREVNGEFISNDPEVPETYQVAYKVGKTTWPKIGYLFAYDRPLMGKSEGERIWVCKADVVNTSDGRFVPCRVENFQQKLETFWDRGGHHPEAFPLQGNECWCRWIRPLDIDVSI